LWQETAPHAMDAFGRVLAADFEWRQPIAQHSNPLNRMRVFLYNPYPHRAGDELR
jgi:hypothetical protein